MRSSALSGQAHLCVQAVTQAFSHAQLGCPCSDSTTNCMPELHTQNLRGLSSSTNISAMLHTHATNMLLSTGGLDLNSSLAVPICGQKEHLLTPRDVLKPRAKALGRPTIQYAGKTMNDASGCLPQPRMMPCSVDCSASRIMYPASSTSSR